MPGLLIGQDEFVGNWLFAKYNQPQFKFDRALGLLDKNTTLIGAILFHNWNGNNVELSYYGEGTLTAGIIRCISRFALYTFDPSRVTVTVSKKNRSLIRSLPRIGFRVEGAQRCYYGKRDCNRHTAIRFVMFRERIEQLAKVNTDKAA